MYFRKILGGDAIAFGIFHQGDKLTDLFDRKVEIPAPADER